MRARWAVGTRWLTRARQGQLGVALALAGSFLFCVHQVRKLDAVGSQAAVAGRPLALYNACKVALALHLLLALIAAGDLVLTLIRRRLGDGPLRPMTRLICAGYLGASLVALAMVVLGFLHACTRPSALALTLLPLAAAPFALADPATALADRARAYLVSLTLPQRLLTAAVGCAIVGALAVLVVNKVVYPEALDNDVWEHYLHYYREVAKQGSIWPNDLWYHFYLSKGAGLFFLAVLLSDAFGASLISFCFVALSALVVFDLLHRRAHDPLWGALGVLLLLLYLLLPTGDVASFSKHHIPIMAYLALVLWCSLQGLGEPGTRPRPERLCVGLTGAAGAFYLGFYIPAAAAVLLAGMAGLVCCALLLDRRRFDLAAAAGMAAACTGGVAVVFAVNYAITGLPEMEPLRLMWSKVDLPRFEQFWSRYHVEYYFLGVEPLSQLHLELSKLLQVDPHWVMDLCRAAYFRRTFQAVAFHVTVLVLLAAAVRPSSIVTSFRAAASPLRGRLAFLCTVAAFLGGTLLLAQFFPGGYSLKRMYSFTALFLILGVVAAASALLGPSSPSRSWVGAAALLLLLWPPVRYAVARLEPEPFRYAVGLSSTVRELCRIQNGLNLRWNRATRIGLFAEAQRGLAPGQRLLHLSYDAGPGYLLYGRPVLTEPSYAFGHDYEELLFAPPDAARAALERRHIGHVSINLRSRLFLGLPFAPLFAAENLPRHFELAWSGTDFYVLRLKAPGAAPGLPAEFLQVLELLQKTNVAELFDEDHPRRLAADVAATVGTPAEPGLLPGDTEPNHSSFAPARHQVEAVWDALGQHLLAGLSIPANRTQLAEILTAERQAHLAALGDPAVRAPLARPEALPDLCREAVHRLRRAVTSWAGVHWSPEVCKMLLQPPERVVAGVRLRQMREVYEARRGVGAR